MTTTSRRVRGTVLALAGVAAAGPLVATALAARFDFTASFTRELTSRKYPAGAGQHSWSFKCDDASAGQPYTVNLYKDQLFDQWISGKDFTCRYRQYNVVTFPGSYPRGTYYFKMVKLPNGHRITGLGSTTYPSP